MFPRSGHVQKFFTWTATLAAAATLLVASLSPHAIAQDKAKKLEPVAVVAIASIEEVLGDIGYVTETAGQGDLGKMVALLSGGYTVGMDKKRPLGMVVTMQNEEPSGLLFLPVKNLEAVLAGIEDQVGKPKDAGDGIMELSDTEGKPIYVKQVADWAYVSQKANDLVELPQFYPSEALGDLTKNYTVAVRINVGAIPAEMKKVAVAQMKAQTERKLQEQLEEQSEEERELSERYTRSVMEQVASLIQDTEQITFGLQINSEAKSTHVDLVVTARPDTELAGEMARLRNIKSSHAGLLAEDAAVNFHFSTRVSEEDAALYQDVLKVARENALKQVENDEDLDNEEARRIANDVVNALFDVGQKTLAAGKIEGGAALFLTPEGKVNLIAGGAVQGADRLEQAFKDLIEAAKNEPDAPQVTFDAAQHAGFRFHTMSLPIQAKEQEARQIFGENLDVAIGFGKESVYVAFGPEGIESAKSIIDDSQAQQSQTVAPGEFVVSMAPILQFASVVKEDPVTTMLAAAVEKNARDRIIIKSESIERGVRYRLEIEEGVLQIIGAASKLMNQQKGPADLF
jgi:hypothetical protein